MRLKLCSSLPNLSSLKILKESLIVPLIELIVGIITCNQNQNHSILYSPHLYFRKSDFQGGHTCQFHSSSTRYYIYNVREDGPPRKSRSDCPISGKIISNWVEQQGTDAVVSRATNSREERPAAKRESDNCQCVYSGEWACVSTLTGLNNLFIDLSFTERPPGHD